MPAARSATRTRSASARRAQSTPISESFIWSSGSDLTPIVAFLLGVTDIAVPWATLILSTVLYVVIPLAAGVATRSVLMARGAEAAVAGFTARIKPASMIGLLLTVVLLFGF